MIYATPFILATLLYLAFGIRLNSRRKQLDRETERAPERLRPVSEWALCFDHSEHCCPFCLPHFHSREVTDA